MEKFLVGKNHAIGKMAAAILFTLGACQGWTAPLIEKVNSPAGQVETVRIGKSSVEGRIWRVTPYHVTLGAHVHVALLDMKGTVIAYGTDLLSIVTPKDDATYRYSSYQVEFNEDISQAKSIRVQYVPAPHAECKNVFNKK